MLRGDYVHEYDLEKQTNKEVAILFFTPDDRHTLCSDIILELTHPVIELDC